MRVRPYISQQTQLLPESAYYVNCYALIDRRALTELLGINSFKRYQQVHKGWIENELKSAPLEREPVWTQCLTVGHKDYVKGVKLALGIAGRHRSIVEENDAYGLKEPVMPYATHMEYEVDVINAENTILLE
jgi:hypothetical protein